MSIDPADGELLTRAILQAEASKNPDNSRYGAQSFVHGILSAVGESMTHDDNAWVATVDMLEIPPKLRCATACLIACTDS
jgi:hypothetical protein